MAVKYRANCSVCKASKDNPKFRARVYHAAFKRSDDDESLGMIAREIGFTERAMYNHAKKHMWENPHTNEIVRKKKSETIRASVQKELEVSFDHENVVPKQDFEKVWDQVIQDGINQLEKKDTDLSINQILAATKLKSEFVAKKRGQDTEIIKAMYRSLHGATPQPPKVVVPEPDRPSGFLGEAAGDATT